MKRFQLDKGANEGEHAWTPSSQPSILPTQKLAMSINVVNEVHPLDLDQIMSSVNDLLLNNRKSTGLRPRLEIANKFLRPEDSGVLLLFFISMNTDVNLWIS